MTKAILKFDLNDPDDTNSFRVMQAASNMYFALQAIAQHLRSHEKYDGEPLTIALFHEILQDNAVDLDSLGN